MGALCSKPKEGDAVRPSNDVPPPIQLARNDKLEIEVISKKQVSFADPIEVVKVIEKVE
jgi:hypothetical protein